MNLLKAIKIKFCFADNKSCKSCPERRSPLRPQLFGRPHFAHCFSSKAKKNNVCPPLAGVGGGEHFAIIGKPKHTRGYVNRLWHRRYPNIYQLLG